MWTFRSARRGTTAAFVLAAFLLSSGCIVWQGTNQRQTVSGSIDDHDDSTTQAGGYSSNGFAGTQIDGQAFARSLVQSHNQLEGEVKLTLTQGSMGPFSGTPGGESKQTVQSDLTITEATPVKFTISPWFTVTTNQSGIAKTRIAIKVLDARGNVVRGSNYHVTHTFKEYATFPHLQEVDIVQSNSGATQGTGDDGVRIHDPFNKPSPFTLVAGSYTVVYEVQVNVSGDTQDTTAKLNSTITLQRAP